MFGWIGFLLRVNMRDRTVEKVAIDVNILKQYIGRGGLGAYYIAAACGTNQDELQQPVIAMMTGPLTGLFGVSNGRCSMITVKKGVPVQSDIGGSFGPELKMAGYDGILIEGTSEVPVYLYINNGSVLFCEAGALWGEKTGRALSLLKQTNGTRNKALCIGPAGEHRSLFAGITGDDGYTSGAGFGAVLGVMNLKGIAVHGEGVIKAAKAEAYLDLALLVRKKVTLHPLSAVLGNESADVEILRARIGSVALQDFENGVNLRVGQLSIPVATGNRHYLKKRKACYSCTIGCRQITAIHSGAWRGEGVGSAGEALEAFAHITGADKPDAALKAMWECNEYGIHAKAVGKSIPTEAYDENTLISLIQQIGIGRDPQIESRYNEVYPAYVAAENGDVSHAATRRSCCKLAVLEAAGICRYCLEAIQESLLIEMLETATGEAFGETDLEELGERIVTLYKE